LRLRQQLSPNLLRLRGQSTALIVTELKTTIPDLLPQYAIFFHQIFDDVPLMLVHTTSHGCDKE